MGGMMTKEELKPVMMAWCDGKTIQVRSINPLQCWDDFGGTAPYFCESNLEWRIKPEKKLRPWKPEEVPMPCVLRTRDGQTRWQILTVSNFGVGSADACRSNGATQVAPFEALLENNEYCIDGKGPWLPCGIEE